MNVKPSIYWVGPLAQRRLAIMPRPRSGDWLEDELNAIKREGVSILVSLLTRSEERELGLDDEGVMAERLGVKFFSFPIPDRDVPADKSGFLLLAKELHGHFSSDEKIAIHCRMGIGRSSMLAATVLGLSGIPLKTAFSMIQDARGRPVPDTTEQQDWVLALKIHAIE